MFLQQFAIDSAVIWRGWSEYNVPHSEFSWLTLMVAKSPPPCCRGVTAVPNGCRMNHSKPKKHWKQFWRSKPAFHLPTMYYCQTATMKSPFEYRVPQMLDKLNQQQDEYRYVRSSFSQFFKALESTQITLPVYQGELISPKYMRIHRGIFRPAWTLNS